MRLIERCRTRPIEHVAAEMGISRATASKWVNRYKQFGELWFGDRSSIPHRRPSATPGRPIAHVAAGMGIARAAASKWVNRYRQFGELWFGDHSSTPHRRPTATPGRLVNRIATIRRERKWSASRTAFEMEQDGTPLSRHAITRLPEQLGLNRRKFVDPNGGVNREPQKIIAEHPGQWSIST